jgi:hypothetical protein
MEALQTHRRITMLTKPLSTFSIISDSLRGTQVLTSNNAQVPAQYYTISFPTIPIVLAN